MPCYKRDIDLVYLWVDGNDPKWLRKKALAVGRTTLTNEGNCDARFLDNDELKFSLRSVNKYAPWIRNIFIVTDNQIPSWLDIENPKIKMVYHQDIMPKESLPCFNSNIIEHFIANIPHLSEHFLYANDDMFLNSNVEPAFFFLDTGEPIVRLQRSFSLKVLSKIKTSLDIQPNIYRTTLANATSLIERRFGKFIVATPHHNIDAYLKSEYLNVAHNLFQSEINSTITNKTRQKNDIQRIIYSYYLLVAKRAKKRYVTRSESCRIRLQRPDFMQYIQKFNPIMFCLNDTEYATDADRARVTPFLSALFPDKSIFEK